MPNCWVSLAEQNWVLIFPIMSSLRGIAAHCCAQRTAASANPRKHQTKKNHITERIENSIVRNIPGKGGNTCNSMPPRNWQPTHSDGPFLARTSHLKRETMYPTYSHQRIVRKETQEECVGANSQTEQWWHRGGFSWLHFRQYRILGFTVSGGRPPNSDPVNGSVSPLSSSKRGFQLGGTLPGSVKTTVK